MPRFNKDGYIWCEDCPFDGDSTECAAFHDNPYDSCPTEETYDKIMKSLEQK